MKVQGINNQIFGAKFRVPMHTIMEAKGEKIITKHIYKEYSSPAARALYEKALLEKNNYKKEQLIKQMGNYDRIEEVHVMDRLLPEIRALFSKDKK